MPYIAVADDEKDLREIIEIQLSKHGYEIKTFESGKDLLKSFSEKIPDLVLLDIMMDNMNGYETLSEIRRKYSSVSVIFLTAKTQTMDKVLGLDLGADDYMTKPFQKEEILARIKAVLRRKKDSQVLKSSKNQIYRYQKLVFNSEERNLSIGGEGIEMTKTEFLILKLLSSVPKKVFTRDEILESVWSDTIVNERTIDVHIKRLRKKLGEYEDIIKTHSGFGYSILAEE
ncbi:MAG TPA: DNA-binding response regulator [Spirochaetia bacterium]|nr:DNA-binding response regulator [Spirochaetia bacterium]